ncbi:hypothetical protein KEM54_001273 [Ascosphaera aggregata]|nr:hypothetical protein KEM54_001273 [Ascosphaera aggregata]
MAGPAFSLTAKCGWPTVVSVYRPQGTLRICMHVQLCDEVFAQATTNPNENNKVVAQLVYWFPPVARVASVVGCHSMLTSLLEFLDWHFDEEEDGDWSSHLASDMLVELNLTLSQHCAIVHFLSGPRPTSDDAPAGRLDHLQHSTIRLFVMYEQLIQLVIASPSVISTEKRSTPRTPRAMTPAKHLSDLQSSREMLQSVGSSYTAKRSRFGSSHIWDLHTLSLGESVGPLCLSGKR